MNLTKEQKRRFVELAILSGTKAAAKEFDIPRQSVRVMMSDPEMADYVRKVLQHQLRDTQGVLARARLAAVKWAIKQLKSDQLPRLPDRIDLARFICEQYNWSYDKLATADAVEAMLEQNKALKEQLQQLGGMND
jgi:hypothetical protein